MNLRDGASATAKVIGSVPRDTKVRVLEHRGKWVRIEMPGDGKSKALPGWAFSTYLKDLPAPAKTPLATAGQIGRNRPVWALIFVAGKIIGARSRWS
ncbi:MAG: SH3 domain-containing protein [Rhizomicrobium sp.]